MYLLTICSLHPAIHPPSQNLTTTLQRNQSPTQTTQTIHPPIHPPTQIVLGKQYVPSEMADLSRLFNTWVMGLFTVAPFDLPFLPFLKYPRALRAREVWRVCSGCCAGLDGAREGVLWCCGWLLRGVGRGAGGRACAFVLLGGCL